MNQVDDIELDIVGNLRLPNQESTHYGVVLLGDSYSWSDTPEGMYPEWISDICTRLRRAVTRNNLPIVKLISKQNLSKIRNPDYQHQSNTSLHIACQYGYLDMAKFLVDAGHEDDGISRNTVWETPLMLAARGNHTEVAKYMMERFPHCVQYLNNTGMDLVMICSQSGAIDLLPSLLISDPPFSLAVSDQDGNTALHHAATGGDLGIIQLLLQYGASALQKNKANWTAIQYSATIMVELYFTKMVATTTKQRADESKWKMIEEQKERKWQEAVAAAGQETDQFDQLASTGGVPIRMVTADETSPFPLLPDEPAGEKAAEIDPDEADKWAFHPSDQRLGRKGTDEGDDADDDLSSPDGPNVVYFP